MFVKYYLIYFGSLMLVEFASSNEEVQLMTRSLVSTSEANNTKFLISIRKNELQKFLPVIFTNHIEDHWLKFPKPDLKKKIFMIVIQLIIVLLGCLGNTLLFYILIIRNMNSSLNLLVINLTVSDFFGVIKIVQVANNTYNDGPMTGEIGCQIYGFVDNLSKTASVLTWSAISLYRYKNVDNPSGIETTYSKRITGILVVAIWTFSLLLSAVPAVDTGSIRYVPYGYLTTCGLDIFTHGFEVKYCIVYLFDGLYLTQVVTQMYFFGQELWKRYDDEIQQVDSQSRRRRNSGIRYRRNVMVDVALCLFPWIPFTVVTAMTRIGFKEYVTPFISISPELGFILVESITPWVEILRNPVLKANLIVITRWWITLLMRPVRAAPEENVDDIAMAELGRTESRRSVVRFSASLCDRRLSIV